jgi:phospholipase C
MHPKTKRRTAIVAVAGAVALGTSLAVASPSFGSQNPGTIAPESSGSSVVLTGAHSGTTTPIKHVVVIFDENVSFDHYFGTYPNATNTDGTRSREVEHPEGRQPDAEPAERQPEPLQPDAADPVPGADLRPGPQLHAGAAGLRQGRSPTSSRSTRASTPAHRRTGAARPGDGLLRRQHRHRAVELRAELRDERQQLRHHLRPVHPGRDQPDLRPDHGARWSPTRSGTKVSDSVVATRNSNGVGTGHQRPRPGLRRLLGRNHTDNGWRR